MKTILLTLSLILCFSVSAEKTFYYNLKPVKAYIMANECLDYIPMGTTRRFKNAAAIVSVELKQRA